MKTRKMMKILLTLCTAFAMLLALALPTFADVIFEPDGDNFFNEHREECTHGASRGYLVNTADGYIKLYESPLSDKIVKTHPNGQHLWIEWTYTDATGTVWGITYHEDGWMRLSELSLIYDVYSFSEEHRAEFVPYVKGSFSLTASEETPVILYDYPGGALYGKNLAEQNLLDLFTDTYTDAEGRVWGHFEAYYMGRTNGWVCLSDPYNAELASAKNSSGNTAGGSSSAGNTSGATNVEAENKPDTEKNNTDDKYGLPRGEIILRADPVTPTAEQLAAAQNGSGDSLQNDPTLMIVAGALIGVAVIVTGILIAVFFRKKACK